MAVTYTDVEASQFDLSHKSSEFKLRLFVATAAS